MANDLECRKCKWFRWIPGCIALSVVVPCSEMTKPKGQPCIDFEPRETPLLVDELDEALYWLLNLHHGVSRGGTEYPVTDAEWKDALDTGMRVHARYQKEKTDV